jgi:cystathionine beta-lyase/cystathionine gamma-synthase
VTSDPYGAVAPPLYQTATYHQLSAVEFGEYDYSRSGNPTRTQLEAQMAELEVGLYVPCRFTLSVYPKNTREFPYKNVC